MLKIKNPTSNIFLILILLTISLSSLIFIESSVATGFVSSSSFDYTPYINAVNVTAVKEHVKFFSSLGTRATGYPGNEKAAQYIYEKFIEYGLENVTYDPFPVVDCISYGANVTILSTGEVVEIHPLVPNLVCPSTTPPSGIKGKLVYVGKGGLRDLRGVEINGSIVLMDWNSGSNWIWVAQFGAKAVIFLPPKYFVGSRYGEVRWRRQPPPPPGPVEKVLWELPVNFPRFYVEEKGAQILMDASEKGLEVRLVSTQRWTQLTGKNVIGFVKGGEKPEGIIIISSYYDSYSVAPSVAPGAQEAIGVSTLLELAKYFAQRAREGQKPPVTLMFVAFGGHHQTLAGAINFFTENFFFPPEHIERREFGSRVWRLYNLDLSTGSDVVYMVHTGSAIPNHNIQKACLSPPGPFGDETKMYQIDVEGYIKELRQAFPDKGYEAYALLGYDWNIEPESDTIEPYLMPTRKFAHESELTIFIGPAGWTFTTAYDPRPYYWTPFDTFDKINWKNLQTQLEIVYSLLLRSIDECLTKYYEHFGTYPTFKFYPGPWNRWTKNTWEWGGYQHWCILYGKVAVYDEDTAFWKPLKRSDLGNLTNPIVYFRGGAPLYRRFVFADDEGNFKITGAIYSGYEVFYEISAWVIDPETGNVVYVPDMGPRRYTMPIRYSHTTPYNDLGFLTVFKASTMAILDLPYPTNLGIYQVEETGETFPPQVSVYHGETYVPPDSYAVFSQRRAESLFLVAFPPEVPVKVFASVIAGRYPFACILNASLDNPHGYGYKLKAGEQMILPFPVLQYAKDVYYLNTERVETIRRFSDISKLEAYKYYLSSKDLINKALSAVKNNDYLSAYSAAIDAWIYGYRVYQFSRKTIEDATAVVPFFAAIVLPFTFLAEKLLFNWRGYKKAISLILVFSVYMISLSFLHPGFSLSASPANIVIGFSVLILSFPIVLIIINEAGALLREIRVKTVGKHEIEVSRTGQAIYAFTVGIENMRKRKLRTVLTLITVIIMVSSIVNFTALSSIRIPMVLAQPPGRGQPIYKGIYIHKYKWGLGGYSLGWRLLYYLESKYGNESKIVPRAWRYTLYPSTIGSYGEIGFAVIYNGKRPADPPKTMLGLTPEETEVTGIDKFLLPESNSRWFLPGEHRVCILSQDIAEELGIDPMSLPVNITIEGLPFKVIGIMSEDAAFFKDLHEEITPIKRDFEAGENPWDEHVMLYETIIMPFEDVMDMGGGIASVTIIPNNPEHIKSIANEFYNIIPSFLIFYNVEDQIFLQRQAYTLVVGGFESQIIPLTVVAINVFSIILAAIYERKREIAVYSSVGLSPLHVAMLFLAETIVYGVVGSISAYLLALVESRFIAPFLPIEVNYSSTMVIFSIGVSMLAVFISSIYPAFLSSRLVTPSLERAWRFPTKPVGDVWNIPLPFVTTSELETIGTMNYLREYMLQHQLPDAPVFMASNIKINRGTLEDKRFLSISALCRLAPYQIGVVQEVNIMATEEREENRWPFVVLLKRVAGPITEWERLNRDFVNEIREQLLLWRSLPEDEKAKYMKGEG